MSFLEIQQGDSPLILGFPHTGTDIPDTIAATMNETGRALADTDWHIHQLYDGLAEGVTSVRTRMHRYVIDVNRDPAGVSLYPGQNTTTLVPLTDFDGKPIWNQEPDGEEIKARRQAYHAPYHAALGQELERVKAIHGFAILYDCHSIRSHIPFLFEGTLPDFNVGTDMGKTCAPTIEQAVFDHCVKASGFSHILNGRFKGGWTTRHYGQPQDNIHAIQMELAQSTYLTEEQTPWHFDRDKAERLRMTLRPIIQTLIDWSPQ